MEIEFVGNDETAASVGLNEHQISIISRYIAESFIYLSNTTKNNFLYVGTIINCPKDKEYLNALGHYIYANSNISKYLPFWLWCPGSNDQEQIEELIYDIKIILRAFYQINLTTIVVMLLYIDKYIRRLQIIDENIGEIANILVITSFIVTMKMYGNDVNYYNKSVAEHFNIDLNIINSSEIFFILKMEFKLLVDVAEFNYVKEKILLMCNKR
jgi:hypothetical protein